MFFFLVIVMVGFFVGLFVFWCCVWVKVCDGIDGIYIEYVGFVCGDDFML